MSSYSQTERLQKKQRIVNRLMLIPIAFLLGIVPLIVRLVYLQPKDGRMNMLFGAINLDDYYSQGKAVAIIITTIIMLIMGYLTFDKREVKWDKYSKFYLISASILVMMTIVSTCISDYKEIALWGVYDRAEGMIMWCCYIIMMFYTFYSIKDEQGYKWVIGALGFLVIVTAILGIFQYAGYDLLTKTKLGLAMIVPEEYKGQVQGIASEYTSHKVLGTMYHYNYVGSFGAMVVPLFVVLMFRIRGMKRKVVLAGVTLAAVFVLLGSTSRAGLIGIILAMLAGMIVFARKMMIHWKRIIPIGLLAIVVLMGYNFATNGSIFSRIPTLVADIGSFFDSSNQEIDYKNYIPVRALHQENGEVTFVLQEDQLKIGYIENEIRFTDGDGKVVKYTIDTTTEIAQDGTGVEVENYTLLDPHYSFVKVIRQNINVFTQQEAMDAILVTINETGHFSFKLDETGVTQINAFSGLPEETIEADYIGFKGKEKLGSARGYIWSRSLAVLKNQNLLIGNGPDTFIAYFPQNDTLAKWWAYDVTNMTVDKPHNLYLQIAMNQGGIALLAFLALIIIYLVHCMKLYALRDFYTMTDALGIGIMLGIVGYLGAGFFNDSVVSVAPIFWILLGAGMAINYNKQSELKSV